MGTSAANIPTVEIARMTRIAMREKNHARFSSPYPTDGPRTGAGIQGPHAGSPQAGQKRPEYTVPHRLQRTFGGADCGGPRGGAAAGAAHFGQKRPSKAVPPRAPTIRTPPKRLWALLNPRLRGSPARIAAPA